jgi:hypothetical protein
VAKITEAKDMKRTNLSWLIYGKSRVGKTALIGTFPPPICVTNFPNEDGAITLAGHSDVTVYGVEGAKDMDPTPGSGGFADWVASQQKERVAAGKQPFRTVAVDSLTSYIELLTREHVEKNGRIRVPTDLYLYDEWGVKIRALVDRLRTMNVELVVTATAAINKDELTGVQFGGPDLFRSMERRIPAKVAVTIYMEADSIVTETVENGVVNKVTSVKRVAHLTPWNGMTAGVRGCIISGDGCIVSPTYSKIIEAMGEPLFD